MDGIGKIIASYRKAKGLSQFEVLPISSIEHFFKRFYIAVLNNYADTLFLLGKHGSYLERCDKAITFATENEILYLLEFLL